jgi:hypothetical protein
VLPFFVLPLFVSWFCPFFAFPRGENLPQIFRRDFFFKTQNKKPTRLRVGWNFSFIALTTNSPLASYLGGTQNRNQYE